MLAIRMQRTGRKGSASFRIIVQDSRFSPSSGRVVARVGHFDPHTKETTIDKDKITEFLKNGAQPTPRVVRLLTAEKVKMPSWVEALDNSKKSKTKNPSKLRKNQPKEEKAPEAPAEEAVAEEKPAEETKEAEKPAEEPATEEKAPDEVKGDESEAPKEEEKPAEPEAKEEPKPEEEEPKSEETEDKK